MAPRVCRFSLVPRVLYCSELHVRGSEVELKINLGHARVQNLCRRQPRGKSLVDVDRYVGIQDVIQVEADNRARFPRAQDLAKPEVELVPPVEVNRVRRDEAYCHVGRRPGKRPAS